jgi:hypothetical protein|tara:strand:+ start:246 stop:965 length:720 start_codon:yes stop_codon:yes gene_type:complete
MPTLTTTLDGQLSRFNQSTWAGARDGTSAAFTGITSTRSTQAVAADKSSARGGGTVYNVARAFFEFNTSGISVAPTDATLKIYGYIGTSADLFVVKSSHSDGSLSSADFDSIDGWSSGADNSSNVTKYSSEVSIWANGAYVNITLNSTALNDIANNDTFKICLIESDFDLPNNEPSVGTTRRTGMYFVEFSGTSTDPIIDYTEATPSGYGHNVIGVSSGDIDNVIGVATADIDNVIDVS